MLVSISACNHPLERRGAKENTQKHLTPTGWHNILVGIMRDELEHTLMQHKRYDNIDGTGEMFMGLMFLGFALLGYLQTVLPEHSMWRTNGFGLLFIYAVLVPVLGLGYLVQRVIKKHITWPRTGYVAHHSIWRLILTPRSAGVDAGFGMPTRKGCWGAMLAFVLVTAVVSAGFAVVMVFEMRQQHGPLVLLLRVAYLVFWVPLYAFWVFRMGREQRWKWLVLFFMALGLTAIGLIVPGSIVELSRWVMLFVGLMWILSGGITLSLYLRHTHPAVQVTE